MRENAGWLAVGAAFLFSASWGIRSFGIQDNNEGIYAEIAREMNARGDWIVPHLDGAPYLEKPPLLYWLISSLLRVFGEHEWVVRLGPVLCFAGTLAAVLWIGRQLKSETVGRNAALILCSAAGVVGMSRSLLFDVPLTCALTWTFACFLRWRLGGSPWFLRACFVLIGLGVMTKGLIAIVLGGGTMVTATWIARRSWRDVAALVEPVGLLLFGAIVIPWHVLASLREPGFADFYFINEHVRRFLGSRQPHDFYTGPVYYYLVRLPLYLGVWVFALPVLARKSAVATACRPHREGRRLLGCAIAVAFTFFSFSEGKANYYLLVVMPALAVLIALAWPADGARHWRLFGCAVGVAALAALLAASPWIFAHKPDVVALLADDRVLIGGIVLILATVSLLIAVFVLRGQNTAALLAITAAGLVLFVPAPILLQKADARISERAVADFLAEHPDQPVVLYREYESLSSVVFYLKRTVPVVDSMSNELYYAHQRYAHSSSFMNDSRLCDLARRHEVWVVTTPEHADELLRILGTDGGRLVRRFPRAVVVEAGPGPSGAPSVVVASRESARLSIPAPARSLR